MKADHLKGKVITPILFEEMDGAYLKMQGKDRKNKEIKIAVTCSDWKNNYDMDGVKVRVLNGDGVSGSKTPMILIRYFSWIHSISSKLFCEKSEIKKHSKIFVIYWKKRK